MKVTSYIVDESVDFALDTPVTVRIEFECTREEIAAGVTEDIPVALSLAVDMVSGLRKAGETTEKIMVGDGEFEPGSILGESGMPTPHVIRDAPHLPMPPVRPDGVASPFALFDAGQRKLSESLADGLRAEALRWAVGSVSVAQRNNRRALDWWQAQRQRDEEYADAVRRAYASPVGPFWPNGSSVLP